MDRTQKAIKETLDQLEGKGLLDRVEEIEVSWKGFDEFNNPLASIKIRFYTNEESEGF